MMSGTPSRLTPLGRVRRTVVQARVAAEIALWRHGWLWAMVAALLIAICGVALSARLSLQHDAAQLHQEIQALENLRLAAERRAAAGQDVNAQIDARLSSNSQKQAMLASVLATRSQANEQVRRIYKLALQQQVAISQVDFQSNADGTDIDRLQINIPTKASYPQLRRFLEATLQEFPNASLDRLSFKRSQVGDTQIEARVYLSLWLRASDEREGHSLPAAQFAGARP